MLLSPGQVHKYQLQTGGGWYTFQGHTHRANQQMVHTSDLARRDQCRVGEGGESGRGERVGKGGEVERSACMQSGVRVEIQC